MELKRVIDEAKEKTGLNQDELATRIGLDRTALSHVLHGRRKLKAEAAIELFDITGIHPRKILEATVRPMALIALGVVLFFLSGDVESPFAAMAYAGFISGNTHYGAFVAVAALMLIAFQSSKRTPTGRTFRAAG